MVDGIKVVCNKDTADLGPWFPGTSMSYITSILCNLYILRNSGGIGLYLLFMAAP